MLKTIEPEIINTISENGAGEELEFSVVSGATETVASDSMTTSIQTTVGGQQAEAGA